MARRGDPGVHAGFRMSATVKWAMALCVGYCIGTKRIPDQSIGHWSLDTCLMPYKIRGNAQEDKSGH